MSVSKQKAQTKIAAGSEHFILEYLSLHVDFTEEVGFKLGKGGWVRCWICRAEWREQIRCSHNGCAKMHTSLCIRKFGRDRGS